jgi:predicted RNase H-like nuclease
MAHEPGVHDLSRRLAELTAGLCGKLEATGSATASVGSAAELAERGQLLTRDLAATAHTLRQLCDALGVDLDDLTPPDEAAVTTDGPSRAPAVEVTVPVLGVEPCPAGWVGAILEPGAPRPRLAVAATIGGLVETVRQSLGIEAVAIDIPIGLPDDTLRKADALAREALAGNASSVLTTLTRAAYREEARTAADAVNRALTGQGVGAPAFALRERVLEVDAWVRSRPTVMVIEVHPELSFAMMAGGPIEADKKTDEGQRARLAALAAAGLASPSVLTGTGYAADDVIDACAAAWTAARRTSGVARPLPDPPQIFTDGIPAAIWA